MSHSQESVTFDCPCSTKNFSFSCFSKKTYLFYKFLLITKIRENTSLHYKNFRVFIKGYQFQFLLKLACKLRNNNKTSVFSHFITSYLNMHLF